MKQTPDADSKMKLILLSNGRVDLQACNGKYLSRIAYSRNATNSNNHIQPIKSSIDHFSQFEWEYNAESQFENVGTVILKADNGCYLAPHDGITVKPLATKPYEYIFLVAKSVAETDSEYEYYYWTWKAKKITQNAEQSMGLQ